ncbi:MAG: hypothetical protein GHHEDOFH_02890 [Pseudorhodoplanes sp.]|nr:hypothetical protein [Pseudorhodoplanes sp.]
MTPGSAPNCRAQNAWLRTTACSSPAWSPRPHSACRPSIANIPLVTHDAWIDSVTPPTLTCCPVRNEYIASTSVKVETSRANASKLAGETG